MASIAPPKPHDELTTAANLCARQAPNAWDNFVATFKKYEEAKVRDVVRATPDQIIRVQGQAAECGILLDLFEKSKVK